MTNFLVKLGLVKKQDNFQKLIQFTLEEEQRQNTEIEKLYETLSDLGVQLPERSQKSFQEMDMGSET